jgi:signal peptidase I
MKKIISNSVFVAALLLFLAAVVFVVVLGKNTEDIYIFGYKPFVIATGSMETEYMTNSVVVIQQSRFDEVQIGDVIAFRAESFNNNLAFHRVIHRSDDSLITKGDNNSIADELPVTSQNYIGREVFHTNLTAYYAQELAKPNGYIRVVVFPILALVMLLAGIYLFSTWSAEKRLKRLVAAATMLSVCIAVLIAYFIWDNARIDDTNTKLTETADQFQTNSDADTSMTVNGRDIIGVIEIPAINIKYPIIEYENEASLNISIAKYAGPDLNKLGNVVLTGHRSTNGGNLYFTKIDKLQTGDVIKVTDEQHETQEYLVESYSVHSPDDLSVLATNRDRRELTLISCTSNLQDRYIVVAVAQ